ncbi:Localization factor PodJS [Phenylobacterium sp.]|uniref:SEL1-like repeat protein n=1 Tax=Phenylobacterium sp. TaxID=1871053 RepID=UPI00395ECB4D
MTAGAPWSVKGIDPKAREVAKDLARRSGMTLGEWLNRVILEDDPPEDVAAEHQVPERPQRLSQDPPRLQAVPTPQDTDRLAHAIDRLSDRIEASETRTGLAISGVEHSVRQALARIEMAEREQLAMAERLARMEADPAGPRSPEALRILEARIARAEAAGGDPAAFEGVLQRLTDQLAAADRRFEILAADLTERVERARAEMAEQLRASAAGDVGVRLARVDERLQETERRSAQAVEQMGKQVLAMAEAVNRRLMTAEQQSAGAIEQVGGEIARIAGAVEARLARAEQTQAEALERLGAEIGRITDRLSERLAGSEQRAAQAIDDVGQHVIRATERIEQRQERAAGDLAERIRASEERTARLLDEARARLGVASSPSTAAEPGADSEALPKGPFGPELFSRAEPLSDVATVDPVRPSFAAEDFEAAEAFAPLAEPEDDVFELDEPERPSADGSPPLSTREVIDQARAAARAQKGEGERPRPVEVRAKLDRRQASGRMFNGFGVTKPRRPNTALQTALMVAGGAAFLSVGAAGVVLMNGPQAEENASVQDARPAGAMPANPRAAAAVSPEPAIAEAAQPAAPLDLAFAEATRAIEAGKPGGLAALKAVADQDHPQAQFYLAQLYEGGRQGVVQNEVEARRWTARAAEGGEPRAMHNLGLYYFRGEGGPQDLASAAQWFRKAAELGVVDSQYNLGVMYQSGSGVQKDPAEALKWLTLAAGQGDGQARAAADALKAKLPAATVKAAEAAVAAARRAQAAG